MGRRNQKTLATESCIENTLTYGSYLMRLLDIAIARCKWLNLPDTIDERFLEFTLTTRANAVFFYDEDLGYLALPVILGGRLSPYGIPVDREAYAVNGYRKNLTQNDSVVIFNNYLHTSVLPSLMQYAKRLYDFDRIIDVNVRAQKTPVLLQGSDTQMLTLKNLYNKYDGNAPVIFGDKNLDISSLSVLKTNAPFVAEDIYRLKTKIWNEALTFLGISSVNTEKKERLITDEVADQQGDTFASRFSFLKSREQACREINRMFGLSISVEFNDALAFLPPVESES